MLTFTNKTKIFIDILSQKEISYADSFNANILISAQNFDFNFLKKISSQEDIQNWIDKLKSRMVMKEDDIVLQDIIDDYILCG